MKSLGFYTDSEKEEHFRAEMLPTDYERQRAFDALDQQVRKRLRIPSNRYYSIFGHTAELILDESRIRPKRVHKISKSNQPSRA